MSYRCTACRKPFPGWGKLREHHQKCPRFIERQDGIKRTFESQGASVGSVFGIKRRAA